MSARDPLQELRDPFHELKDAFSFPVSPDFCARVRQQVAAEPVRSRMFGAWRLAAAAIVLLATAIGVITTFRHVGIGVVQVSGPRPGETTNPPVPSRQNPAVAIQPVRVPRRPARVAASEPVRPYETVVPDDQLHALDRLLAAMRQGRATVPPVVADAELNDRGERVLRALVIEPVIVNPIKDPNK